MAGEFLLLSHMSCLTPWNSPSSFLFAASSLQSSGRLGSQEGAGSTIIGDLLIISFSLTVGQWEPLSSLLILWFIFAFIRPSKIVQLGSHRNDIAHDYQVYHYQFWNMEGFETRRRPLFIYKVLNKNFRKVLVQEKCEICGDCYKGFLTIWYITWSHKYGGRERAEPWPCWLLFILSLRLTITTITTTTTRVRTWYLAGEHD